MADGLVLLGGGGHASVVAEAAIASGRWDVVGYVAPRRAEAGAATDDLQWLGNDEEALGLEGVIVDSGLSFILGLAGANPGAHERRERLAFRYAQAGARFAVVVHPTAWVSASASLLPGSVVLAGAVVNAAAVIGPHSIVNSRAVVEHDATVGAHCHIGPGAVVGGGAHIADGATVSLGALVRDHVVVQTAAFVGMGAVVVGDVASGEVVIGNPARSGRAR